MWGIWLWTEVPSQFIQRLHLVKTPFGALVVHWLRMPDPEPWRHDHPATFLSLIFRGSYTELRKRPGDASPRLITHRWFNFIRASSEDTHKIISVEPNTITLCFMGPKKRKWGYHTDRGWIFWKTYQKQNKE